MKTINICGAVFFAVSLFLGIAAQNLLLTLAAFASIPLFEALNKKYGI